MTNTPPYPPTPSGHPYRYPGVQPFTTAQSAVFYGREQDTADLHRLIRREALVVLYGKSGLGKSSLLNAGIVPHCLMEAEYTPVVIKFGAWTEGKTDTPLELTKAYLSAGYASSATLHKLLPGEDSLWRCAKNRQLHGGGRPLLIFDQFEELFTYPEAAVRAFRQELAELLHTELPLRYRRLLDAEAAPDLSEAEEEALETPLEARIVFAIRSDRMHLLHQLAEHLPNILRNLYELRALNPLDAQAAIVQPAQQEGDFSTPSFTWSPTALSALLGYLQDPLDENCVEGILLQLLCQYFEKKLVEQQGLRQIEGQHLGDLEKIIENYYHDKLASLPDDSTQYAARKLIEEGLVMEGENIRLSLHEAQITQQYGVDADLLERLVNSRLLRAEPFLRGGYTYELAHDRLVAPVLRAKQERIEKEIKIAEEKDKREREQKLAEEQHKRKQANRIAIGGISLAVVTLISLIATLITLRNLEKVTASVVRANLKEAEHAVLNLDYQGALKKIGDAAKLGSAKPEVAAAMLEIAFWYTEIGEYQRATRIIKHALRLSAAQSAQTLITQLAGKKSPQLRELRKAIALADPAAYQRSWARYYPGMIRVKGGSFMMGCDKKIDTLCEDDETLHRVSLSDFEIAATETTVWQWHLYCEVAGMNIDNFKEESWDESGDNPAINVSWYDAVEYANWLSTRQEFKAYYKLRTTEVKDEFGAVYEETSVAENPQAPGFHLPTEAQWEYAAKGGTHHSPFVFSGSNEIDSVAWYREHRDSRTRSCKGKKPNQLGIYGMSGNVWEWCWDWHEAYDPAAKTDPRGPNKGSGRILRGGSWRYGPFYARVAGRDLVTPDFRYFDIGFRLARQR